jgi:HAMP domain-containing protein
MVIELSSISRLLNNSKLENSSFLSIVRYDTGIVISDTNDSVANDTSLHVSDTGIVMEKTFAAFQEAVNFSAPWTGASVEAAYQSLLLECRSGPTIAYPLPLPPDEYDPNYKPIFLLINAIGNDVFDVITEMDKTISDDVARIIICSVSLGFLGFLVLLLIVWCVSRMLTRPLRWMDETTQKIIATDAQREDIVTMIASDSDQNEDGDESSASPYQNSASAAILRCSPRSEVNELVEEFRLMIQNFSGSGPASVAETTLEEIKNNLTWHSEFHQLYSHQHESSPSPSRPLATTVLPPSARGVELETTTRLRSPESEAPAVRDVSNGTKRTDEHTSSKESQNQPELDVSISKLDSQGGTQLRQQEAPNGDRTQNDEYNAEQSPVSRNVSKMRPDMAEKLEPAELEDILCGSRSPQQCAESRSVILIVPGACRRKRLR